MFEIEFSLWNVLKENLWENSRGENGRKDEHCSEKPYTLKFSTDICAQCTSRKVSGTEKRKCQSIFNCWLYFPLQHPACKPQFLPPHPSVCMELPINIQLKKPWTPMEQMVEKWHPLYHQSTLCSWEQQLEALKPALLGRGWNLKSLQRSHAIYSDRRQKKKMEYPVARYCFSGHWCKTMDNTIVNGNIRRVCLAHKLFRMWSRY